MPDEMKTTLDILQMIAEELQEESWRRLERGREKLKENPDDKWQDYDQGVIHGMDEGAQKIYRYIERIKNHEMI